MLSLTYCRPHGAKENIRRRLGYYKDAAPTELGSVGLG
jgi:hypothetical protein